MSSKSIALTVHPPIPQTKLGRYRAKKGVYLIRHHELVLYIGASENMYKAVMRLFQKQGVLAHLERRKLQFEIIETKLRSPSVENVLKRHFKPPYNQRIQKLIRPSDYEKKQCKRILESYLHQSRFDTIVQGESKTDSNPF